MARLIQKLATQGDISLEEADEIYSFFLDASARNYNSFDDDFELILEKWFKVTADKIKKGERGNFIFTIHLDDGFYNKYMYPAKKVLKERGNIEDLCKIVMIDKKLHFPTSLKSLFTEIKTSPTKGFYDMINSRAGIYYYPIQTETGTYTLSQFLKKFSPVIVTAEQGVIAHALLEKAFKITLGAHKLQDSTILGKREIQFYLLATLMRYNDIPCVFVSSPYANKSIIFAEEKGVLIAEKASEVPLEELTENAMNENIIDKDTAKELLDDKPILGFPIAKFVKASVEYLNEIVILKMARECIQEVEDEDIWLDVIR